MLVTLIVMPRPKSDALAELSSWMEQVHQLTSALAVLDARLGWPSEQSKAAPDECAAADEQAAPDAH